jgi:hypothetical protein
VYIESLILSSEELAKLQSKAIMSMTIIPRDQQTKDSFAHIDENNTLVFNLRGRRENGKSTLLRKKVRTTYDSTRDSFPSLGGKVRQPHKKSEEKQTRSWNTIAAATVSATTTPPQAKTKAIEKPQLEDTTVQPQPTTASSSSEQVDYPPLGAEKVQEIQQEEESQWSKVVSSKKRRKQKQQQATPQLSIIVEGEEEQQKGQPKQQEAQSRQPFVISVKKRIMKPAIEDVEDGRVYDETGMSYDDWGKSFGYCDESDDDEWTN